MRLGDHTGGSCLDKSMIYRPSYGSCRLRDGLFHRCETDSGSRMSSNYDESFLPELDGSH